MTYYFPDGDGEYLINDGSTIHGQNYPGTIDEQSTCQSSHGGEFYMTMTFASHWSYLTGYVGLADDSGQLGSVKWRIYMNGKLVQSGSAAPGGLRPIHIGTRGVYQLTLWLDDPQASSVDCGFGRVCHLLWANMQLA